MQAELKRIQRVLRFLIVVTVFGFLFDIWELVRLYVLLTN